MTDQLAKHQAEEDAHAHAATADTLTRAEARLDFIEQDQPEIEWGDITDNPEDGQQCIVTWNETKYFGKDLRAALDECIDDNGEAFVEAWEG